MPVQEALPTAAPSDSSAQPAAAVIVAFWPDELQINKLIAALLLECRSIYLMDNGGGGAAITLVPGGGSQMHIIDMGGNRGLGQALNRGLRLAAAAGFHYVTTFDQDSEPKVGQIAALIGALKELESTGKKVAAVGPRIVDPREARRAEHAFMRSRWGWPSAAHCSGDLKYIEVDYLITAGSVISTKAYAEVGEYDPALFVDYTDVEWCFRALQRGYHLYGVCSVRMSHELSTGVPSVVLGMTILGYPPLRRYYYARNIVLLLKRPHVTAGWKVRLLGGLVARILLLPVAVRFASGWMNHSQMLLRGLMDGLRSVGGERPHAG